MYFTPVWNGFMAVKLSVRVHPRSKREYMTKDEYGEIHMYVKAPPVDGRANKACIDLIHRVFHIPKKYVTLIHGEKGRRKVFEIEGVSADYVEDILSSLSKK